MSYFTGKVIWITGASSGIGEALVSALAKEGARLVLSSRNEATLIQVKERCGLTDDNSFILALDLEHLTEPEKLVARIQQKFGEIDILINNGGMSQRALAKDTPVAIDRRLMEVDYFGPVALTKSVLPSMIRRQQGQIVVISSISGKFGFFLRSAYSAAKHALHGFFETLRLEVYENNIQVLLVCPGMVATNISLNAVTAEGKRFNKMDKGQANGMPVAQCAAAILDAMREQKEEVIIGSRKEKIAVKLKRFFPGWFSRMIRKQKMD
jgi:dehydrogenase/reductase SDR family protein 7B